MDDNRCTALTRAETRCTRDRIGKAYYCKQHNKCASLKADGKTKCTLKPSGKSKYCGIHKRRCEKLDESCDADPLTGEDSWCLIPTKYIVTANVLGMCFDIRQLVGQFTADLDLRVDGAFPVYPNNPFNRKPVPVAILHQLVEHYNVATEKPVSDNLSYLISYLKGNPDKVFIGGRELQTALIKEASKIGKYPKLRRYTQQQQQQQQVGVVPTTGYDPTATRRATIQTWTPQPPRTLDDLFAADDPAREMLFKYTNIYLMQGIGRMTSRGNGQNIGAAATMILDGLLDSGIDMSNDSPPASNLFIKFCEMLLDRGDQFSNDQIKSASASILQRLIQGVLIFGRREEDKVEQTAGPAFNPEPYTTAAPLP